MFSFKKQFGLQSFVCLISAFILILAMGTNMFLKAQTSAQDICPTYPCQRTFIITAYYSPLPDQNRYLTGSFEAERRLNGYGVHGADGTPVYAGMIAAPKIYPFGLKIDIPGIGVTAVHDRGGAIVSGGERDNAHDRLDVWMGKGDIGLKRALAWGRRTVQATVLGIDETISENVYLEGYGQLEDSLREAVTLFKPKNFTNDFGLGASGDEVSKLQRYLAAMGYYSGSINGDYDEFTRQAVIGFQLTYQVIGGENEFGAGYFGPNSRRKFDQAISDLEKGQFFTMNLGRDATGIMVSQLQNSLKRLGYLNGEITGRYDASTIDAIYRFQKDNNLVSSESDAGAGYFGPNTRQNLHRALLAVAREEDIQKKLLDDLFASNRVLDNHPDLQEKTVLFKDLLKLRDEGDEVRMLQQELAKLGYFRTEATGYYGAVTSHAVLKLQQALGLIKSDKDTGAGVFDAKTRAKLQEITGRRLEVKKLIASRREEKKESTQMIANKQSISKSFIDDLDLGTRGQAVLALQKVLIDQGFLKSKISTDYFGEKTKQALIAWQLANGIIADPNDQGAGRVGPRTREKLQGMLMNNG